MSDIYQRQELLEIYKDPPNRGKIDKPSIKAFESNPLCGDVVELELEIENDKIVDAKFDGDACSVSIISSAFLTEEIIGKTLDEAMEVSKKDLLDLIGVELTTSRVKCATLVLEALNKAINEYKEENK